MAEVYGLEERNAAAGARLRESAAGAEQLLMQMRQLLAVVQQQRFENRIENNTLVAQCQPNVKLPLILISNVIINAFVFAWRCQRASSLGGAHLKLAHKPMTDMDVEERIVMTQIPGTQAGGRRVSVALSDLTTVRAMKQQQMGGRTARATKRRRTHDDDEDDDVGEDEADIVDADLTENVPPYAVGGNVNVNRRRKTAPAVARSSVMQEGASRHREVAEGEEEEEEEAMFSQWAENVVNRDDKSQAEVRRTYRHFIEESEGEFAPLTC